MPFGVAKWWQAGPLSQRSAVYGYFAGGATTTNTGWFANTDQITFATAVTAAKTTANLSNARDGTSGVSDRGTHGFGWFAGGGTGSGSGYTTLVDRLTLSTATIAASDYILSAKRGFAAPCSDSTVLGRGYFAGGGATSSNNPGLDTTDAVVFATGVILTESIGLSKARNSPAGVSDGKVNGYFCGGATSANVGAVITDLVMFVSGEILASTASNLKEARYAAAGVSDQVNFGYVGGGCTGSTALGVIDRITFATTVTAASTVSSLTARAVLAANSDGISYGYFAGGSTAGCAGHVHTAERLMFSTAVVSASTVSNLKTANGTNAPGALSDFAI